MDHAGLSALLARPYPAVMGVLNVTPDSFSDGGRFLDPADARLRDRFLSRHVGEPAGERRRGEGIDRHEVDGPGDARLEPFGREPRDRPRGMK